MTTDNIETVAIKEEVSKAKGTKLFKIASYLIPIVLVLPLFLATVVRYNYDHDRYGREYSTEAYYGPAHAECKVTTPSHEYITENCYETIIIVTFVSITVFAPLYYVLRRKYTKQTILNKNATFLCWWQIVMVLGWAIIGAIATDMWSELGYSEIMSNCLFVVAGYEIYLILINYLFEKQYEEYKYDYLLPRWLHCDSAVIRRLTLLFVIWPIFYLGSIPIIGWLALCWLSL